MGGDRHLGCADWHTTHRPRTPTDDARVFALSADELDAGAAALVDAPTAGITRRQALAGAGGLAFACSMLPPFGLRQLIESAAAQNAADPNGRILVSIYLDGGNDGLNTLVPLTDPDYRRLRPRIAVDPTSTIPLAGRRDFGWHPSLSGLAALYDAGKVAVLPAVDYANPDQSHFNSQTYWRTGVVGPPTDPTGWLGRTMDVLGSSTNPLQAVSMGWNFDPVLQSRTAPVATIVEPSAFQFAIPGVNPRRNRPAIRPYRAVLHHPRSSAHRAAQEAYRQAIQMFDQLEPIRAEGAAGPPTPLPYPDDGLGNGMRSLARILSAGFGTRVATIAQFGYDTHGDQLTRHPALLGALGATLQAWQADLDARGLSDRVLTLVWSEFGRRVEDNDSLGCDHGAGGCVLLVGNHATGGIQSEFPGLANRDDRGNLRVTTEFRTLYATLLESWLGIEAGRVLPGIDARRLPLVR